MTSFPADRIHIISDDAVVIGIARELGVFDKIVGRTRLAHAVTGMVHTRHASHWLLFLLFTGMQNPADNGWLLASYPRSAFELAEITARLKTAIESSDPQFLL